MSIQLYSSPMKYKDPTTGNYVDIIGISGNPGRGIASVVLNNDYTLTINFTDNTSTTTDVVRGAAGVGIQSIAKTATSGNIDTYTITYTDNNTSTFTVTNGITPSLTIGTVVEGAEAAATITGTSANPVLNLVLPSADLVNYATKEEVPVENGTGNSSVKTKDVVIGSLTFSNTSNNIGSFAEGLGTSAIGAGAHAEGVHTTSSKQGSHAEGDSTVASANASHAEGYGSAANGSSAHAEGISTIAKGFASHTQGYGTIANGSSVHVEGVYNVEDTLLVYPTWIANTQYVVGDRVISNGAVYECITANADTEWTYTNWKVIYANSNVAHIVGNGADSDHRSNAYALTWTGDGHFAGDVYVGANSDSSGGIKLVKETAIAPVETATATAAHAIGDLFMLNGKLLRATAAIAIGDTITVGTNASETKMSEALASAGTVQDVRINDTSIVSNGIASIPWASDDVGGVLKISTTAADGIATTASHKMMIAKASNDEIKAGSNSYKPIVPNSQDKAVFYGLAKAAGADMKDIANTTVGQYPDAQKEAIQSMLGVSSMLAPENPNLVATQAYAIGDIFAANGHLYKATVAIVQDEAIIPDTNCVETTMVDESVRDVQVNSVSIINNGVANIPIADRDTVGVIKIGNGLTIDTSNKKVSVVSAAADAIKNGSSSVHFLNPNRQHISTFYGLSKVAGVDLANETVTLGTYTPEAQGAIQSMLGVSDLLAPRETSYIASQAYAVGDIFTLNGKLYKVTTAIAESGAIVVQDDGETISGANAIQCKLGEETIKDVQVNGTSILQNGVANVPLASNSNPGVIKTNSTYGLGLRSSPNQDTIMIAKATNDTIKSGNQGYQPIVPSTQHNSVFYGLAKAAGDATQSQSDNAVGTYTDDAKASIQSMLGTDVIIAPNETDPFTNAHVIGDLFTMNGKLYRAKTAITASDAVSIGTNCEEVSVFSAFPHDVQVNGTSVVTSGVANVPKADNSGNFGVVKFPTNKTYDYGINVNDEGVVYANMPSVSQIKQGTDNYKPIVPSRQDAAAFYGFAKAAGDSTQSSSSNAVGTYTDTAKEKIQHMLGTDTIIAPNETNPFTSAHAIGELFTMNGKLYRAKTAIAVADAVTVGTNCEEVSVAGVMPHDVQVNGTSVVSSGVANIPVTGAGVNGVCRIDSSYGVNANAYGRLYIEKANATQIKDGTNQYKPIVPYNQDVSTFYGLAKAAGDTSQSQSDNAVGTYTDSAKASIQHMLGTDTNLADYESDTTADAAYAIGELFMLNGKLHQATAAIAIGDTLTVGTNCSVVNASEVFPHDVQVNDTSVVQNGVANIPKATNSTLGVVSVDANSFGIKVNSAGKLYTDAPSLNEMKAGTQSYKPIVASVQHTSVFYGLAKAAGDTTQSASSNAVGTYTDNAKASIKSMLGIVDGSTSTVSVTGTTPSITAVENTRYTCGEVSTLTITPPASGICIVRFTSGTTPTVLTATGVVWPAWFDATDLEADTTYEICITDGYGAVMSWAL